MNLRRPWFLMEEVKGDAAPGAAAPGAAADPKAADPKAADPKAAPGSLLDGEGDDGKVAAPPADWPTDWRQKITTDEKVLKRLERYGSPKAVAEALLAAQQKISSGELKDAKPFPEKGTPDEQKAWREEHGLPAEAKGYDLKFDNGLVIGELDKPQIDAFLEAAHAANMPPGQVKATVEWYFKAQEKAAQEIGEADKAFRQESEDALRSEWGNDYRANLNRISGFLDQGPQGLKDLLLNTRLADGKKLGDHPTALRWLLGMAPSSATVVPAEGQTVASAIEDEIAGIEKLMGDRGSDYWKGPKSDKMQSRYRELITMRDSTRKR